MEAKRKYGFVLWAVTISVLSSAGCTATSEPAARPYARESENASVWAVTTEDVADIAVGRTSDGRIIVGAIKTDECFAVPGELEVVDQATISISPTANCVEVNTFFETASPAGVDFTQTVQVESGGVVIGAIEPGSSGRG